MFNNSLHAVGAWTNCESLFACGSSQQAWKRFGPQQLAGKCLLKAYNDKMQCNLMQLQPCLLKVISELFSSVVMGTVSLMADCCLMAPAVCLLDRAAQTASFAGEELIISMYTQPAEQLATVNQDYDIILCKCRGRCQERKLLTPPPQKKKRPQKKKHAITTAGKTTNNQGGCWETPTPNNKTAPQLGVRRQCQTGHFGKKMLKIGSIYTLTLNSRPRDVSRCLWQNDTYHAVMIPDVGFTVWIKVLPHRPYLRGLSHEVSMHAVSPHPGSGR